MNKFKFLIPTILILFAASTRLATAQTPRPTLRAVPTSSSFEEATESSEATLSAQEATPEPTPSPRADFTQKTEETIEPLEELLAQQQVGSVVWNPLKYAIREAVGAGVPPNTIVLLLLLPLIAALIAAARHIVGVRGYGIFLPAALSVAFLAIGPVIGIFLFLLIVVVSTYSREIMKKAKFKMQYLPKMALILWFVSLALLGVLFLAPVIRHPDITNISIFPVLILVLLAEDYSKTQLGKSARSAIADSSETIILGLFSYIVLVLEPIQQYALLHPEFLLIGVGIFDIIVGRYVGLRFVEYWRFRKLLSN